MSTTNVYVALPNGKSPRLCFRLQDVASIKDILKLYQPYSLKGKALKMLAPIAAKLGIIQHLDFFRLSENDSRMLDSFSEKIAGIFTHESPDLAFLKGTPGPHQKWTARVSSGDRVLGYVKIANSKEAVRQLQIEVEQLKWIESNQLEGVKIPGVFGCVFEQELCFVGLTPPEEQYNQVSGVSEVEKIANISTKIFSLEKSTADVTAYINSIISVSESTRVRLFSRRITDWMTRSFPDGKFLSGVSHGDYASWNIFSLKNGGMFVFDWEYSKRDAPALFDVFHFIFMPAMLLEHCTPAEIVDRCLSGEMFSKLVLRVSKTLQINEEDISSYFALYLCGVFERFSLGKNPLDYGIEINSSADYVADVIDVLCFKYSHQGNRKKVLVSAYACDPEHGSEPGVGWNMVKAISKVADVWVVTRRNNLPPVEKGLLKENINNVYLTGIDLPPWLGWWKRGQRGVRTYYYLWQYVALYEYRKRLRIIDFDLSHHVTFVNDWIFSFLGLTGLPFIWGPIGSHPPIPILLSNGRIEWMKDRARYLFQAFVRLVDPMFWVSAIRAKRIVGISEEVAEKLPLCFFKYKFEVSPAIGVEMLPLSKAIKSNDGSIRLLSAGNFVPIKQFHLVLKSFALIKKKMPNASLTLVGKGKLEGHLKRMAQSLYIDETVNFYGWMPREQILGLMRTADVFVYPSAEASGMVVLESMVQGTPVVCLKYGGPSTLIGDAPELKIELLGSQSEVVDRLASRVVSLLAEPEQLSRCGRMLRCRSIRHYAWSRRHVVVSRWYRELLSQYGSIVRSDN